MGVAAEIKEQPLGLVEIADMLDSFSLSEIASGSTAIDHMVNKLKTSMQAATIQSEFRRHFLEHGLPVPDIWLTPPISTSSSTMLTQAELPRDKTTLLRGGKIDVDNISSMNEILVWPPEMLSFDLTDSTSPILFSKLKRSIKTVIFERGEQVLPGEQSLEDGMRFYLNARKDAACFIQSQLSIQGQNSPEISYRIQNMVERAVRSRKGLPSQFSRLKGNFVWDEKLRQLRGMQSALMERIVFQVLNQPRNHPIRLEEMVDPMLFQTNPAEM
ncbi:unnamed protein product [Protopolystoma xenopodis]|uniref:Uncharacterized protein n=1 Tax=Protopolystoma xenopodis TaxID=117903 RepID=A0A448WB55_9PLAT|nr:unnamed protein product [Protopolystoma xenopodis]